MPIMKVNKKAALLTYKEKLLEELKYYEARIKEESKNVNKTNSFDDEEGSDSDTVLPAITDSTAVQQLKKQESMLQTCTQATQELTGLDILQAEVNVMVEPPVVKGETPIKEAGEWREVTAECCVDMVPFSITFYAHCAHRKSAPTLYRGMRVAPLKTAQEAELAKSVLPGLKRPSDAVEVLRSYALAYRSRRSTLARLADKFGTALFMEPLAEGGYLLKCANVLQVSWTLQNKWSPIAPFHHRMKFDLEYMDESYIKQITSAHRQLSEPSVDTNERTLLLAKIVTICLQAAMPNTSETTQDDITGARVDGRRTTLDQEPDVPGEGNDRGREVMAPPKSLPKKSKQKSKDATADSRKSEQKPAKRSIQDDNTNSNIKKPKVIAKTQENLSEMVEKYDNRKTMDDTGKNAKNKDDRSVASAKNVAKMKNKEGQSVASGKNKEDKMRNHKTANDVEDKLKEDKNNTDATHNSTDDKNVVANNKGDKNTKKDEITKIGETEGKTSDANAATAKNKEPSDASKKKVAKSVTKAKNGEDIAGKKAKTDVTLCYVSAEKTEKKPEEGKKSATTAKNVDTVSAKTAVKSTNPDGQVKEAINKVNNDKKRASLKRKSVAAGKNDAALKENDKATGASKKTVNKAASKYKNITGSAGLVTEIQKDKVNKPLNDNNKITKNTQSTGPKIVKPISTISSKPGNIKSASTGNTEKENLNKNTKIPQKKTFSPKGVIKKAPIRISPRKNVTKPKTPLVGKKVIQKPVTGIPRLVAKPKPKVT